MILTESILQTRPWCQQPECYIPMLAEFWAGYISGAAGIVIGNPLDIIKVRAQASSSSSSASISQQPFSHSFPATTALPNSALLEPSLIPRLRSYSAFTALLRGLPAPVLTYGALNALLFTSYTQALVFSCYIGSASENNAKKPSSGPVYPYSSHFTAGCFAGIATYIISTPTELIKCRAQITRDHTSSGKPISSWMIARSTYALEGIRGLYRGGCVTALRDSVGYGFYFLAYETSKDMWDRVVDSIGKDQTSSLDTVTVVDPIKVLLCGGLAGVL